MLGSRFLYSAPMGDDMGYAQLAHNLNSLQYECGRFERNVHESRATLAHASNFAETLGTMVRTAQYGASKLNQQRPAPPPAPSAASGSSAEEGGGHPPDASRNTGEDEAQAEG